MQIIVIQEKKKYEDKDILNNGIGNSFIEFINNILNFQSWGYEKMDDSPEDLIYNCKIKSNNEDIILEKRKLDFDSISNYSSNTNLQSFNFNINSNIQIKPEKEMIMQKQT